VLGQLADVAHVFLLGRAAIIFELDELLEWCDGGIVRYFHTWGEDARECGWLAPQKPMMNTPRTPILPKAAAPAAQFNKCAAANRRPAGQSDGSDDLSATLAADRAFPAAVADPGRSASEVWRSI
jgi:hypothetical protein